MEKNVVLANRLKSLMEEKGFSYRSLSDECGVPIRTIYRMMAGGVSNPSVFVMMRICNALGMGLDEFFGTEELQAFGK